MTYGWFSGGCTLVNGLGIPRGWVGVGLGSHGPWVRVRLGLTKIRLGLGYRVRLGLLLLLGLYIGYIAIILII